MPTTPAIRPAEPVDADAVRAVLTAAFAEEPVVADLWPEVERRGLARASLVATDPVTGEVVGHVGLSHSWLDTRERLVDVLVLSPLGVLPDRQRHGIGARLLADALAEAARLGAPAVFLEGDPGYYRRHGFVPAVDLGVDAPSARIPGPACQVAVLPAHEAWMTGRLVYRDVWWEYDAVGLRDPDLATVERSLSE